MKTLDKAEASRRWDLKEIKELKRKNPYEIEIAPFQGEKYELKLAEREWTRINSSN